MKTAELDFGIQVLNPQEVFEETTRFETAWVLLDGKVQFECGGKFVCERHSLFDESPSTLHVSAGFKVRIHSLEERTELAVVRIENSKYFEPKVFMPSDVSVEYRGRGLVQEACLREVKSIFDYSVRPESNLVMGEVVNYPGRWSSYPPHHHAQPEIYHYRFTLPQGYGHAEVGEKVFKVRHGDTIQIPGGMDHAQVSAPGYGMYYLWIVQHLPVNPYLGFEFTEEHKWLLDPSQKGWEPKA